MQHSPLSSLLTRPRLAVAVAALVAASLSPGCGKGTKNIAGAQLGVVLPTKDDAYYDALAQEVRSRSGRRDVQVTVQDGGGTAEGQAQVIRDMAARGFRALIVVPMEGTTVEQALNSAAAAGIPVVLLEGDLPGLNAYSRIASDNAGSGRLCADYLGWRLKDGGKVAVLNNDATRAGAERLSGFQGWLAEEFPRLTVAATERADDDRQCIALVRRWLAAHPDLRGLFLARDSAGDAVARAAAEAGRRELIVVGVEGSPEARSAIEGKTPFAMFVAHYPLFAGKMAWRAGRDALQGEAPEDGKVVRVPVVPVVRDTLSSFAGWLEEEEPLRSPSVPWESRIRLDEF